MTGHRRGDDDRLLGSPTTSVAEHGRVLLVACQAHISLLEGMLNAECTSEVMIVRKMVNARYNRCMRSL